MTILDWIRSSTNFPGNTYPSKLVEVWASLRFQIVPRDSAPPTAAHERLPSFGN